jgi:hypothetical protein
MAQIVIPFGPVVDDTGTLVAGATVTVASVKSPLDDSNIASHGATVVLSSDGLRLAVLYDVATKGEAWITLAVSKSGSTITGLNASPVAFAAADAQSIAAGAASASTAATQATTAATQATAANTRVQTGVPNAAPGASAGVARTQDIPSVGNIQAGTSLADLAYMITGDGTSTPQFTADALENAPTGGSGGTTRLLATPLKSGRIEPVRYTRGATGPDLRDWVMDGSGNRLDITGYTALATMIRVGTEGIVFEDEAASLGAAPTEGQVELEWPAGALDAVGEYRLIWSLASGGEVLTLSTLVVVE